METNQFVDEVLNIFFMKSPSIIHSNEKRIIRMFVSATDNGIAKASKIKAKSFSFKTIFI
tara:strand:- start:187 stop:366 length:180 start_codon:yes stop_codon:yes gene_type:complete